MVALIPIAVWRKDHDIHGPSDQPERRNNQIARKAGEVFEGARAPRNAVMRARKSVASADVGRIMFVQEKIIDSSRARR